MSRYTHNFLHIKHSGPVIKFTDRKGVLWQKRVYPLTKKTLWQVWYPYVQPRYESQHTVILLLLSLALYHPFHYGRKPQSPNLLFLYEPLHVTLSTKKKKSFSGSLLLSLVCAHSPVSLQAQIKYLHACPLAQPLSHRHSAPFLCICKERYILERRFPSPHITLSTQWFLEQSQCTVQFHFLTVIERTPDTA